MLNFKDTHPLESCRDVLKLCHLFYSEAHCVHHSVLPTRRKTPEPIESHERDLHKSNGAVFIHFHRGHTEELSCADGGFGDGGFPLTCSFI